MTEQHRARLAQQLMPEIAYPRFARAYNWLMSRPAVRRGFDPVRHEIVGQAGGLVLEVGAGGGQNFPYYDPTRVLGVEAVEPDETMLVTARRQAMAAPVPITPVRATVEALPYPDAAFDSAVGTLVFCSVRDPEQGLRELWRVLKPGGRLLLLEHVRASGALAAWVQDALIPLTVRCMANDHWNRDTVRSVLATGFRVTQVRQLSGGLVPLLHLEATHSQATAGSTNGTSLPLHCTASGAPSPNRCALPAAWLGTTTSLKSSPPFSAT